MLIKSNKIFAIILLSLSAFFGCKKDDKNSQETTIIGDWVAVKYTSIWYDNKGNITDSKDLSTDMGITFRKDGTGAYAVEKSVAYQEIKYTTFPDRIEFHWVGSDGTVSSETQTITIKEVTATKLVLYQVFEDGPSGKLAAQWELVHK